jgi:serine/threonine protein kinase
MNAVLAEDELSVKRFDREAVLARRLPHPNLVRVDDIDEAEDGTPFIVMEYIFGIAKLREEAAGEGIGGFRPATGTALGTP